MKKKDIYEIVIKIIGILIIVEFVEAIPTFLIVFVGRFAIRHWDGFFLISYAMVIFNIVLQGLIAYLCLFRTEWIIKILRIANGTEVIFAIDKRVIYHLTVIVIGVSILIYTINNLAHPDMKFLYNTHKDITNELHNESLLKRVDFVSIVECLTSVLIVIKSAYLADLIMPKEKREK